MLERVGFAGTLFIYIWPNGKAGIFAVNLSVHNLNHLFRSSQNAVNLPKFSETIIMGIGSIEMTISNSDRWAGAQLQCGIQ